MGRLPYVALRSENRGRPEACSGRGALFLARLRVFPLPLPATPPLPEGCFALVPVEEAAEPLVRLIRQVRPHVLTTYDEKGGYPHPDHVMCHRVSVEAFETAGVASRGCENAE